MQQVKICDVTLRDGMQILNREARIPLDRRLALFSALARAGVPYIEVGSFVKPEVVPAMRDTAELLAALPECGAEVSVLVPKLSYYQRLRELEPRRVDTVALFVSASEDYSLANTHMSKEEAFGAARDVAEAARRDGFRLRGYLSCAFRDLEELGGLTDPELVAGDCEQLFEMGCEMVSISDTDGRASPRDLERVIGFLARNLDLDRIGVHLHDRFGQGIANALIAYRMGVRIFDSSVGGIGGSRAVRNSVGNIATEEVVSLFEGLGVESGVRLENLIEAGEIVYGMTELVGDPVPPSKLLSGHLARPVAAGKEPAPEPVPVVVADPPERRVGGAAFSTVFTIFMVPLIGFLITLVLSFFALERTQAGEFLAYSGSIVAFVGAALAAAWIARFLDTGHLAPALLPEEAQRLVNGWARRLIQRVDFLF